jgi:hypothetical protein
MKKSHELAAKKFRKEAAACARKRKLEEKGTPQAPSNMARKKNANMTKTTAETKEKDEPLQEARAEKTPKKDGPSKGGRATKTTKKDGPPQGTRKVPEASDKHGCGHSGLLELLPLERKYLQTYVKVGG